MSTALPFSAVRRQLATLICAAAASPRDSLAASPPAPFTIELPPSFVKLSSVASPDVLLVAGDFRNLIGATGAATTISVQRVTLRPGLLPVQPDEASAAAAALASFRDSQAGNGYVSWPLASTIQWDAHAGLILSFSLRSSATPPIPRRCRPTLCGTLSSARHPCRRRTAPRQAPWSSCGQARERLTGMMASERSW